ncbi:MAG: aminotransferase class I/II-fold pyridoxal phosphate-dependent enzyme [Pseudomonadota bacterium]
MVDTPSDPTAPRLDPDVEAMRELGYRVVDLIVDHRASLPSRPVTRRAARADLDRALGRTLPEHGTEPAAVLALVEQILQTAIGHTDHPRFMGYVPSPGNFVGAMGDALASGFNVFAGHCLVGSGPAAIEATTLTWLADLMGLPPSAGGIFLSGGSMANLSGIHVARTRLLGPDRGHDPALRVYGTEQAHSSVTKALRILGFGPEQYRTIDVDAAHRLDLGALEAAIVADSGLGARPFLVVATAGSTSVGAVDPLPAIRALCDRHGLWLHVDGAYGAAVRLCKSRAHAVEGIELADSLVLDPHKWWFQPYEIGCLLTRDGADLQAAFSTHAAYLAEAASVTRTAGERYLDGEITFYEHGPQLTRGFRALKFWMFLMTQGRDALAQLIEQGVRNGETAEAMLRRTGPFEIVTAASIGILTFRPAEPGRRDPAVIARAVDRLLDDGHALITTTAVDDEPVFRLCPIHPELTAADIEESLERLAGFLAA